MTKIKKALISVWDKTGLVEMAQFLSDNDIEIISTGGTKRILEEAGLDVKSVTDVTKQNEIMDGRVKTLHPLLFGGILADRNNNEHLHDLEKLSTSFIDLVIVNLYPFESEAVAKKLDLDKAIEFIDIGGPSLLRAAAKNNKHVIPLCDPKQYEDFINIYNQNNGLIPVENRITFAKEVFMLTSSYDSMIGKYLVGQNDLEDNLNLEYSKSNSLRYGENPHQNSTFYIKNTDQPIFKQLHGKQLSYNNYFDIESAVGIVYEFEELSCAIVKHSNPCGFGLGKDNLIAYKNAVSTDPVSYFGGIVAFNREVDIDVANELNKSFLECVVAPSFTAESKEILMKKKNVRLITISKSKFSSLQKIPLMRTVFNGLLIQDRDQFHRDENSFEVVSNRKPNDSELKALILGWKLVKFVKSNAIVFNNHEKLLGIGAGQMSRIDSVKIGARKSNENSLNLKGAMMASDAFFPFPDSIELANKYGIQGVIQPGGSIKDEEVVKVVNKLDLIMVLTKERHFYH